MVDKEQLEQFGEAVERKKQAAKEASEHPRQEPNADSPVTATDEQASRVDPAHQQDDRSVREKNTAKGKVTADKWNQ